MPARNLSVTAYFCLEYTKAGILVEEEFEINGSVSPLDPGVCSGPVERCYPPEGGEVEDVADVVAYYPAGGKATKMPYATFREILIMAHELVADERKSAADKADELVDEAFQKAAEDAMEDYHPDDDGPEYEPEDYL